jgi:hypothetical protein
VIVGAGGAAGSIVNSTILESAVVPVAVVLEVPETAEPGMEIAIWTFPALVMFEAGISAVNVVVLTKVVESGLPFHIMMAPETNPVPVAVSVNPCPPAFAWAGLINLRIEEEVCVVRFVLKLEHPDAMAKAASAAINHLREYIRTRSSLNHSCKMLGGRNACEQVPRKPATLQCWGNPPSSQPVSDTTTPGPCQPRPYPTPSVDGWKSDA